MASVKSNIMLNGINTVTGILFPVITFPYAARVLMPEGIGAINFLNSIIGYIVLLTSLGIPMYAVKEVAKYRDDKAKRDQITVEIIALSFILCFLGYIAVWILAECVPQIHKQASLFYVLSLTIVFTTIGVNWFYQGIEDFKFITIRAIIIRTLSAAALFIFVKDSTDLLIYAIIIVGSTVGNNIINFIYLKKHIIINKKTISKINIKKHIHPTLSTFLVTIAISLYYNLNPILIGFLSNESQVGYYTAGIKIIYIGTMLISSISNVLLPRCSNLIANDNMEEYNRIMTKSLNTYLFLIYPCIFGIIALCNPCINVFCGKEFQESVKILYLNSPIIFFGVLSGMFVNQVFYPKNKVAIIIYSVTVGAILNILLGILLIPTYESIGASISMLIAEVSVFTSLLVFGKDHLPFSLKAIFKVKYLIICIIMSFVVFVTTIQLNNDILKLAIGSIIGLFLYLIILLSIKDKYTLEILHILSINLKKFTNQNI